ICREPTFFASMRSTGAYLALCGSPPRTASAPPERFPRWATRWTAIARIAQATHARAKRRRIRRIMSRYWISRQRQRNVLGRMLFVPDGDDDVLLAAEQICHRSGGRPGRQVEFRDHLTGRFVIRAEFSAPCPVGVERAAHGVAAFAQEQQRLRDER